MSDQLVERMLKEHMERWRLATAEAINSENVSDVIPLEIRMRLLDEATVITALIEFGLVNAERYTFGSLCMAYMMGQRHAVQIPEAFKGALDENP